MAREWLKTPEVYIPVTIVKGLVVQVRLVITQGDHVYVDSEEFEFRGGRHYRANIHMYPTSGRVWAPKDAGSFWCKRGFHDEVPKSYANTIRLALINAFNEWVARPEVAGLLNKAEYAHQNNELSRVEEDLVKARATLVELEKRQRGHLSAMLACAKRGDVL